MDEISRLMLENQGLKKDLKEARQELSRRPWRSRSIELKGIVTDLEMILNCAEKVVTSARSYLNFKSDFYLGRMTKELGDYDQLTRNAGVKPPKKAKQSL